MSAKNNNTTDVVYNTFVHPDNDIHIDFEREVQYYSTIAQASIESEDSETEVYMMVESAFPSANARQDTSYFQLFAAVQREAQRVCEIGRKVHLKWNFLKKIGVSIHYSFELDDFELGVMVLQKVAPKLKLNQRTVVKDEKLKSAVALCESNPNIFEFNDAELASCVRQHRAQKQNSNQASAVKTSDSGSRPQYNQGSQFN